MRLPCPPESAADQIADALYIACRNGHVDVVRFLLTKRPDLSFRAFAGATPLHWAYFSGSCEVVDLLLAAGADPRLRDSSLNCTARSFGVITAVNWGFLFHVKKLLGLDPELLNIVDGNRNPLHEAAAGGHAEIVRYLLGEGADRELRNDLGQTARDVALQSGHTAIADLLGT
jgi:ankyrin repeat protein